jgi:CheY-like chemotaxis protein
MDGERLGAAIRANPRLASTILVLLGSMSQQTAADALKANGFAARAAKPVGRLQLLRLISTACAGTIAAPAGAPMRSAIGPRPAGPAAPGPAPEAHPPLRILVAEDSEANQLVTVGLLAKLGHSARVARNGAEAITAVESEAFDLILMDVQMPEVDGFRAAAAIRAREAARGARTPIVAVTAHAVKGDRERCLAAGMDGYLSKPLRRQELGRIIGDVLREDRAHNPAGPACASAVGPIGGALDTATALALLEGDEALFAELVDVYFGELPRLLGELRGALAAGELSAVGHRADRLSGVAKTLSARAACDAAVRLEEASAKGDRAAVSEASTEVESQFSRLQVALAGLRLQRVVES